MVSKKEHEVVPYSAKLSGIVNSGFMLEIITTPNNPDGKRVVPTGRTCRVIHDLVYDWPGTDGGGAVSLGHAIGGSDLRRTVWFAGHRYWVMLDAVEQGEPLPVALRFNHLGRFAQPAPERIALTRPEGRLEMVFLGSDSSTLTITRETALYTPGTDGRAASAFQVEQRGVRRGHIATVMAPSEPGRPPLHTVALPLTGPGRGLRLNGVDGHAGRGDLAVSDGGMIASARWRSDAAALWVEYDGSERPVRLFLQHMTRFESEAIALESDFPVTVLLEAGPTGWRGFVEGPEALYTLGLGGVADLPVRYRRQVVRPDNGVATWRRFRLRGSGPLEIGIVPGGVILPYRNHGEGDILHQMLRGDAGRPDLARLSDDQRQHLRNRIAMEMWNGVRGGYRYWTDRLHNGGTLSDEVLTGLMAVGQVSYDRNAASTYSLVLPHRFDLRGGDDALHWSLREQGTVSAENLDVHALSARMHWSGHGGLSYRYAGWYEGQRLDRLVLDDPGGRWLMWQRARAPGTTISQVGTRLGSGGWWLEPGYRWQEGGADDHLALSWRARRVRGTLLRDRREGERTTLQRIATGGKGWDLHLEGLQHGDGRQAYRGDWTAAPGEGWTLSQGVALRDSGAWVLEDAYSDIRFSDDGMVILGGLRHREGRSDPRVAGFWTGGRHRFSGAFDLHGLRFTRANQLDLRYGHRGQGTTPSGEHRLRHRYRASLDDFVTELFHTVQLPVGGWLILPVAGETLPWRGVIEWVGAGAAGGPLFAQVLLNRLDRPGSIDYQLTLDLPLPPEDPLQLWVALSQAGRRLMQGELRLARGWGNGAPGLYYRYVRGAGSRLEGFLEWRW